MNTRTDLINFLIQKRNLKSYLELGLADGINFLNVKCSEKIGVDISLTENIKWLDTYELSTDKFFESLPVETKFDLIFIDADHHQNQFMKDVLNSLKHLSPSGFIVCHDCNPITEERQIEDFRGGAWNGTVWKGWVILRSQLDIEMFVIDMDEGCGIIHPSGTEISKLPEVKTKDLTYKVLSENRKELLNLISVEDAKYKM